ncbi:NAD(P)H-dependent flavin oxidoreductase [Bradyrhizobium manausense]
MAAQHTIETRFTREYGVRYPFACAGMAFAGSTPALPIAVGKAGGVGAFGVGPLPAPLVAHHVATIRAAVDAPLNLNFITFLTDESHIALCEELKPAIVSFHWGHPRSEWIERLHRAGCKIWEQVGSVDNARRAAGDGIDVIVAQGTEAGGHNYGTLPTFVLVPEIVDAVAPALVLASGGISDGRGVAAALALGADGVWVGTRMVATTEADVSAEYKERLMTANGTETTLSSLWGRQMGGFNPMRVVANKLVGEWAHRENAVPTDLESQPVVGEMTLAGQHIVLRRFGAYVPVASAVADIEQMPVCSGQGVGVIKKIEPAAVVIEAMMREAGDILAKLSPSRG